MSLRIKLLLFFLGIFTILTANDLDSNLVINSVISYDSYLLPSKANTLLASYEKWVGIDSERLENPFLFRPERANVESDESTLLYQNQVLYIYLSFTAFLILFISFSRIFPVLFLTRLKAFYQKASMNEILEADSDWVDGEIALPMISLLLFISLWLGFPLIDSLSVHYYPVSYILIGMLTFALIFICIRIVQTALSHVLYFAEAMRIFIKVSFNTLFFLAVVLFPILIIIFSFPGLLRFHTPFMGLVLMLGVYAFRIIKTLNFTRKADSRQILYLIIYLCTLEIPLLLVAYKWVSDKVII